MFIEEENEYITEISKKPYERLDVAINTLTAKVIEYLENCNNLNSSDYKVENKGNYIDLILLNRHYCLYDVDSISSSDIELDIEPEKHTKLNKNKLKSLDSYNGNLIYYYNKDTQLHYLLYNNKPVFVIADVLFANEDLNRVVNRTLYSTDLSSLATKFNMSFLDIVRQIK